MEHPEAVTSQSEPHRSKRVRRSAMTNPLALNCYWGVIVAADLFDWAVHVHSRVRNLR